MAINKTIAHQNPENSTKATRQLGLFAERTLWIQAGIKGFEIFTPQNGSVVDAIICRPGTRPVKIQVKTAKMQPTGKAMTMVRKSNNAHYEKTDFDIVALFIREFERFHFARWDKVDVVKYSFEVSRKTLNNWEVIDDFINERSGVR